MHWLFPVWLVVAQLQPLPPNLIPLDSEEGRRLLVESEASRDFYALVGQFVTQRSTAYCGVASGVMVLNALPIAAPVAAEVAPFRAFTQDNVFNDEAGRAVTAQSVARGGLTIDQLAWLLQSNHAEVTAVHASDDSLESFRRVARENLARAGDFVIVDFLRSELGQDTGAHWSPLGAYHAGSDRFLVLDVARFRYQPYWVKAEELFRAMQTTDPDSGKGRGYLLVRAQAQAPARIPVPSIGHRLLAFAVAAALAVFVFGGVAGALVMRWRIRRSRG